MRHLDLSASQCNFIEICSEIHYILEWEIEAADKREESGCLLSVDESIKALHWQVLRLRTYFGDSVPTVIDNVKSIEKFEELIKVCRLCAACSRVWLFLVFPLFPLARTLKDILSIAFSGSDCRIGLKI